MDTGVATIVAAIIGAGASIAVALITTRNKINPPPMPAITPAPPAPTSSERKKPISQSANPSSSIKRYSIRIYRAFAWVIACFLALLGGVFLIAGVAEITAPNRLPIEAWFPVVLFPLGLFFLGVATWAITRLSPQSN